MYCAHTFRSSNSTSRKSPYKYNLFITHLINIQWHANKDIYCRIMWNMETCKYHECSIIRKFLDESWYIHKFVIQNMYLKTDLEYEIPWSKKRKSLRRVTAYILSTVKIYISAHLNICETGVYYTINETLELMKYMVWSHMYIHICIEILGKATCKFKVRVGKDVLFILPYIP